MKIFNLLSAILISGTLIAVACNEGVKKEPQPVDVQELTKDKPEVHGSLITESDITLGTPLNQAMVSAGKGTYEMKCQSCHRLTEERLVGPGWKGITQKRQPAWIMNMITNVDIMLESDPEAQKLLEQCLVRMPNQNISKGQAREVLEYMRSNDGVN